MKRAMLIIALALGAASVLPDVVEAQYHGVTQHQSSRRASRIRQQAGWSQPQGVNQQGVPELDPKATGAGLVLLVGGMLVMGSSPGRRRTTRRMIA